MCPRSWIDARCDVHGCGCGDAWVSATANRRGRRLGWRLLRHNVYIHHHVYSPPRYFHIYHHHRPVGARHLNVVHYNACCDYAAPRRHSLAPLLVAAGASRRGPARASRLRHNRAPSLADRGEAGARIAVAASRELRRRDRHDTEDHPRTARSRPPARAAAQMSRPAEAHRRGGFVSGIAIGTVLGLGIAGVPMRVRAITAPGRGPAAIRVRASAAGSGRSCWVNRYGETICSGGDCRCWRPTICD